MKSIILISLFLLISSKIQYDYGVEIPFNKGTTQFTFTAEESGVLFVYTLFEGSSQVKYTMKYGVTTMDVKFYKPGFVKIVDFVKGVTYSSSITLENEEEKGVILFNPSWNEMKVDLNKIYHWKFSSKEKLNAEPQLIFSIDNADRNVTFKFLYEINSKEDLPNPFEVCHGQDCLSNIETYDFIQNESYKIYVKAFKEEGSSTFYFPAFKFGDINGDWSFSFNLRANIWIISLVLLLLL